MKICDNHMHSTCSHDGQYTMLEMADASLKMGVERICFTDHVELDDNFTGKPATDCFYNKDMMISMYRETVEKAPKGIEIFLGIELGEGNHNPELAAEIAATKELDFVIGSLHNLRNSIDFYGMSYPNEEFCRDALEKYMDELIDLSNYDFFDVMAHIGYPVRYILRDGLDVRLSMDRYGDKISYLLKNLIENGKGIEINCSGFRHPQLKEPIPSVEILKRYHELGGEIITVGSDAHLAEHAGSGLKKGYEVLRDIGFKYTTVYEKRKPQFLKI